MGGKLALQYPWRYASTFEPLTDFEVGDMSKIAAGYDVYNGEKELWQDYSVGGVFSEASWMPKVSGFILPFYLIPDRNILCAARHKVDGKLNTAVWTGEKRHLKLLQEAVDVVALPYFEMGRMQHVKDQDTSQYHLYEFCNLDELRRYPVRSINTSVPFTAALLGIDLRLRERRPRNLPEFHYDLRLNEVQLELAYNNVIAIKEALNAGGEHARLDTSLHT